MATSPTKPRLIRHHTYRSWTSTWYDDAGHRRTQRFGKEGDVDQQAVMGLWRAWLNKWESDYTIKNPGSGPAVYTVTQLANDYLDYARNYYVKDGAPTSHVAEVGCALQALRGMFASKPAADLIPPDLVALRNSLIHIHKVDDKSGRLIDTGRRRSVKTVNGRLEIVRDAYRWSVEHGKVPAEVWHGLKAVRRLLKGRSEAIDPEDIPPVERLTVDLTLPHCPPTLVAMIELQWLTGMRPGEVCIMRRFDLDMSKSVWIYTPDRHKCEHLDIMRRIAIGPRSQKLLKPFFKQHLMAYLFSPTQAQAERRAKRHAARKTPLGYGNRPGTNRKQRPQTQPGEAYTTLTYRRAIHHACRNADKQAHKLHPEVSASLLLVPPWNPNHHRHAWATRIRKEFGIEIASDGLGHSNIDTTELYAEKSLNRSIEIAEAVG